MGAVPNEASGVSSDLPKSDPAGSAQAERDLRATLEHIRRLRTLDDPDTSTVAFSALSETEPPSVTTPRIDTLWPLGRARKVSVSLPEGLTAAVQQRVGRGEFSRYVTEAVARQLELDLLAELTEELAGEYGPVPQQELAEAAAAWPDAG